MAPSYRNRDRRANRSGVVDHDIFEGLPVRQWRRDYVTVAPTSSQDNTTSQNDIWAVELPHGMPKDSHLLPQHSQELLKAARSGRIYERPAPIEDDDVDAEVVPVEKPEKKEEDPKDKGFTAKAWKPIPRHVELNDNEYLAKRRKGLVPMKATPGAVTMTKTTVKKIDAAGNEYVQDVVVPHGQAVEGEVIAQTVVPDLSAVSASTPVRRKPIKKKKKSGPGRGRKKMIPTSEPVPAPVEGVAESAPLAEGATTSDVVKTEAGATAAAPVTINEDTEMGDGSNVNSDDDDGEDGDDGDEDEGEINEASDTQTSPSKPAKASPTSGPPSAINSIPNLEPSDITMADVPSLPRQLSDRERDGKSGSPLKTFALITSTVASPDVSPIAKEANTSSLDATMSQQAALTAPPILFPPSAAPTQAEVEASALTRHEEEEEEEMLLDIVHETDAGLERSGQDPSTRQAVEEFTEIPVLDQKDNPEEASKLLLKGQGVDQKVPDGEVEDTIPVPRTEIKKDDKTEEKGDEAGEDDDDNGYPDLLGDLEKSLS